MIDAEIESLQKFLQENCNVKSYFGRKDFAATEYPIVQILPGNGRLSPLNERQTTVDLPLNLLLINGRESEKMLESYRIAWRIIRNMPRFNAQKGHKFSDDFNPTYGDNNFTITFGFNIKLRALGTDDPPAVSP